ncbi:MAG: transcription-repair coupling factor [Candidatus Margulisiibacteriota bacterium]
MLELLGKIPDGQTTGLIGSAKSFVLSKMAPDLIITSSSEQAAKLKDEINFISGKEVFIFPPPDAIPGEGIAPSREVIGERLNIISKWMNGEKLIVIAPLKAAIVKTTAKPKIVEVKNRSSIDRDKLIKDLVEIGYKRMEIVGERGEFSVRGGIIDIFPSNLDLPVRFELFGDKVESLRSFDPQSQRSLLKIDGLKILPVTEEYEVSIFKHLPGKPSIVIDEPASLTKIKQKLIEEAHEFHGEANYISFEEILKYKTAEVTAFNAPGEKAVFSASPQYFGRLDNLAAEILAEKNIDLYIVSKHAARLKEFTDRPVISGELSQGFQFGNIRLLTDYEIFGETAKPARPKKAQREGINESLLADLKEGDFVVHENYGIGIYRGMKKLIEVEGEHLLIEYAAGDKLYVPLTMLGLVEKFSAGEGFKPKLSRLGSQEWIKTKSRVKKSIRDMTKELLELYASRRQVKGNVFPQNDVWQKELAANFQYEETRDQLKAISDVNRDMESDRPMDRLVCGDVGYGKTEVALRAAAKAASAGKQAAILAPTTILAEQHYNNFKERFKTFPFTVEMLSRFRTKEEQKKVIASLATGGVDIVIGTHRLLSKDIKFQDLGLLIIDEEQRFGVAHKEKLKQLKRSIDVLTMSATPIPRTLYFSLSGARDMSLISTPPLDRSPIRTYVLAFNEAVIREAILKELDRGGQVYFVYNRVEKIEAMASKLKKIIPEASIGIGHGQMKGQQLEETMIKFLNREYNVLLCSTIIESGIDIQSVNTIIIDEADRFGLAQLYQLRGRVGRSTERAYAYLFYHPESVLTDTAIERLKAIQEFTALGSGYKLAMKDLEIRGAGNLLGAEQSGQMMAIGFDMYCELLEEAVRELKGIEEPTPRQVEIDIKLEAYIPDDYVRDDRQRIAIYRRMNLVDNAANFKEIKEEIADRFGKIPKPLQDLFQVIELKLKAKEAGVKSVMEKDLPAGRHGGKIRIEYFNARIKEFKLSGPDKLKEITARIGA